MMCAIWRERQKRKEGSTDMPTLSSFLFAVSTNYSLRTVRRLNRFHFFFRQIVRRGAFYDGLGVDAGAGAAVQATEYHPVFLSVQPRNRETLVAARVIERVEAHYRHFPRQRRHVFLNTRAARL